MTELPLDTAVLELPYVGEVYAKKLDKLGIITIEDLLHHLPFRYEDTSTISKISTIGILPTIYTIKAVILDIRNVYTRYGKQLTEAVVEDETGLASVVWFNMPYLSKSLHKDTRLMLSGKASLEDMGRPKFVSPSYEVENSKPSIHLGKLTGMYPETKGVTSKWLRTRIHETMHKVTVPEWLPPETIDTYELMALSKAVKSIHFPDAIEEQNKARQRLAFDEMILIQLLIQAKRATYRKETATAFSLEQDFIHKYKESFSFPLTNSQITTTKEILEDMTKAYPMNRLLQGEVGSGKTIVAVAALLQVLESKKKAAFMVPTSILAGQHYESCLMTLQKFGYTENDISLVVGGKKPNPDAKLYIGTHALLYKTGIVDSISLAVIDEQHRFGVHQREKLTSASGLAIHTLTMTATPIPRTLALSIYGDLDISRLTEMPPGRMEVTTSIVPNTKRLDMYAFIRSEIEQGRQVFVICPLVSLSDKLNVKSAEEEFETLKKEHFADYKIGLLHGQQKQAEKDLLLQAFKDKEYDVLVATPVVEVGIDIPNASVIVIEGAERFGLAQLHQLRGRVGRGKHKSYCFLLVSPHTTEEKERLKVFAKNHNGLDIAEYDLQSRGPGEVYGAKQSGIPLLKAASPLDLELIEKTAMAARKLSSDGLDKYPQVERKLKAFAYITEQRN